MELAVHSAKKLGEDRLLIARHHLLPRIEKAELDEVMVQESRSVGEAHRAFAFDDANDSEAGILQKISDARYRGAVLYVLTQSATTRVIEDLLEDRVELLH